VDSVSVVNLTSAIVQKTIAVGRGPAGVAAASGKAYVTNEDDGTVSVIDLVGLTVTQTIQLGATIRPEAIALVGGFAYITAPAAGPDGMVVLLNLSTNQTTPMKANPDRSGGSSDIAYFNGKLYFANQSGGSVSMLPVDATTGAATTGAIITKVKVDLGARALAIDSKDGLLVVSNEGTGTLVLVSLASNAVAGRINAVQSSSNDDQDDDSDRNNATNLPAIQSLSPNSGKAGTTFTLTITGVNLAGTTAVNFNGNGNGHGGDFTVKNIQVSTAGTQVTATVTIDASAKPGARMVTVTTPNGDSMDKGGAVFVVTP
jgi:YVTN family beta-propeller protein